MNVEYGNKEWLEPLINQILIKKHAIQSSSLLISEKLEENLNQSKRYMPDICPFNRTFNPRNSFINTYRPFSNSFVSKHNPTESCFNKLASTFTEGLNDKCWQSCTREYRDLKAEEAAILRQYSLNILKQQEQSLSKSRRQSLLPQSASAKTKTHKYTAQSNQKSKKNERKKKIKQTVCKTKNKKQTSQSKQNNIYSNTTKNQRNTTIFSYNGSENKNTGSSMNGFKSKKNNSRNGQICPKSKTLEPKNSYAFESQVNQITSKQLIPNTPQKVKMLKSQELKCAKKMCKRRFRHNKTLNASLKNLGLSKTLQKKEAESPKKSSEDCCVCIKKLSSSDKASIQKGKNGADKGKPLNIGSNFCSSMFPVACSEQKYPALQRIKRRIAVSHCLFPQSDYSNSAFEIAHLCNSFAIEAKHRKEIKSKITNHKRILKH